MGKKEHYAIAWPIDFILLEDSALELQVDPGISSRNG
jgi:hypothetical protein